MVTPAGWSDGEIDERIEWVRKAQQIGSVEKIAPSLARDAAFRQWYNRAGRLNCTPGDRMWRVESSLNIDLRHVLGALRVPTLVITHRDSPTAPQSRYLAEQIHNAKSLEIPGADRLPFAGDSVTLLDTIEEFLTGRLPPVQVDRVLATVLFTDIVNSTRHAAEIGDREWRVLLERHDDVVRQELAQFRGREVKTLGDGFLATFDTPARAVRCAVAIVNRVQPLGIAVRAGLHTGEIDRKHDEVGGIAVHIAARIAELASHSEILVSGTVRDLATGSGLGFHDRGSHPLKGLPEPLRLFAATA